MPRKKKAATPIGRGKKGSGKRALSDAGMGRKALKAWRSVPKASRRALRGSPSKVVAVTKGRMARTRAKRDAKRGQPKPKANRRVTRRV